MFTIQMKGPRTIRSQRFRFHPRVPGTRGRRVFYLGWAGLALLLATVQCNSESDPASLAAEICDSQTKRAQMCPNEQFTVAREKCIAVLQCQTYLYGAAYARPFLDCATVRCKSKDDSDPYGACLKDKFQTALQRTDQSSTEKDFQAVCTAKASACKSAGSGTALSLERCTSMAGTLRSPVLADMKACFNRPCEAVEDCFGTIVLDTPYCAAVKQE